MGDSTTHANSGCGKVQELIAWYPTGALDDSERRRVDNHAAGCGECSDLLRFSSDLKGLLLETHSLHPDADALVCFVEDRTALANEKRLAIEAHLAACGECSKQAEILNAVDLASPGDANVRSSPSPRRRPAGVSERRPGVWDFLRGGLFGPIPAAVYLVVALLAIGLQLFGPGARMSGFTVRDIGQTDVLYDTDPISSSLGGVVILPDETDRVRQPSRGEAASKSVDATNPHFLLIELTGLENPPKPDDVYMVEFSERDTEEPVMSARATGQTFRENYTLCFSLAPGALAPGAYVVRVVSPRGDTVYRSSLTVR